MLKVTVKLKLTVIYFFFLFCLGFESSELILFNIFADAVDEAGAVEVGEA